MSNIELKGLKGLRLLDSLTSDAKNEELNLGNVLQLPVSQLTPGKYQPRNQWQEEALQELADSIKSQGIIQPLIVRKIAQDKYEIIAGERRWRAAKMAGLSSIPVIVRDVADNVALAFSLIENIQRENLTPLEEAMAFARFRDEFSMSHSDIADMVGRSRVAVTNILRLLSLSSPVRNLLEEGKLDMGHARALLTLEPSQQIILAHKIVEEQLTVRETEKLANDLKFLKPSKHSKTASSYPDKYAYWSNELANIFSTKVTVRLNNKGTGRIVIHVDSPDQIDWMIGHISIE